MARGGINKSLVKDARDTILLRGDNPSIDMIRIEMGNTGSKTTIHRYLKELEEEEGSRLDDTTLLSQTLRDMIAKVANQLQLEAKQLVVSSSEKYEAQLEKARSDIALLQKSLSETTEQRDKSIENGSQKEKELNALQQKLQRESDFRISLEEKLRAEQTRLHDKEEHIKSLEEKHLQAREALEHFRQSAKEQREQEISRHEQQVQQLQAENRQLSQIVRLKQNEITQLNKDNGRLANQFSENDKQLREISRVNKELENKLATSLESEKSAIDQREKLLQLKKSLEHENNQLKVESETHKTLIEDITRDFQQHRAVTATKELELAELRTELRVHKEMFDKLGKEKVLII